MKKVVSVLTLCAFVLLGAATLSAAPPSSYKPVPYDEAVKRAAENGQPVMIYFWASWCSYCEVFAGETLTDPNVIEQLEVFQSVSVDGDKDKTLTKKYKVNSYPTFVFLSSEGKEVYRFSGALQPALFWAALAYVEYGGYNEMTLEEFIDHLQNLEDEE